MKTRMKTRLKVMATAALFVSPALAQTAQSPAEFYAGKNLTFYVGLSAGGGYDQNARLVARYMGKYIPGQPNIIVRNMPGGGGLVMMNYVASVAPKDGLHVAVPQRGVPFEPLLGAASHAKFDPLKMHAIGSVNSDTSVALVAARTGIKTWQDLRTREVIVAGTGVSTESVVVPYVLRNTLGLKYRVIAGYPGGNEVNLAIERGEADGRGTFSWTSLKPQYKEWVESGKYVILYQQGLRRHPDLANVPLITDMAETQEQKDIFKLQFSAFEMGRPLFVGDDVPMARVTALRRAFDATMKDKALIADAEKAGMEVNPMTGEEMFEMLKEVYATPKEIIAKLAAASSLQPDLKVLETKPKDGKKPAAN
jgi:tripartite-type tricarboxylate transporter receptor subunit TctC